MHKTVAVNFVHGSFESYAFIDFYRARRSYASAVLGVVIILSIGRIRNNIVGNKTTSLLRLINGVCLFACVYGRYVEQQDVVIHVPIDPHKSVKHAAANSNQTHHYNYRVVSPGHVF